MFKTAIVKQDVYMNTYTCASYVNILYITLVKMIIRFSSVRMHLSYNNVVVT